MDSRACKRCSISDTSIARAALRLIRRTPDMTLLEIPERLVQNCGEHFSVSVLWRFFDRHVGIDFEAARFDKSCRRIDQRVAEPDADLMPRGERG